MYTTTTGEILALSETLRSASGGDRVFAGVLLIEVLNVVGVVFAGWAVWKFRDWVLRECDGDLELVLPIRAVSLIALVVFLLAASSEVEDVITLVAAFAAS